MVSIVNTLDMDHLGKSQNYADQCTDVLSASPHQSMHGAGLCTWP